MHLKREEKRFEVLPGAISSLCYLFIYLFECWVCIAALGLSSCGDQEGDSSVAVSRLLIAMASLVTKHGL